MTSRPRPLVESLSQGSGFTCADDAQLESELARAAISRIFCYGHESRARHYVQAYSEQSGIYVTVKHGGHTGMKKVYRFLARMLFPGTP